MKNAPRVFNIDIPIPIPIFLELSEYMDKYANRKEISELAGLAVSDWLAARAKQIAADSTAPAMNGYQWKELYLPSGTVLRTVFKGQNHHATVTGDAILFEGNSVSPSQFVNAVSGGGRNAWRVLWLYFPGEHAWKLAATCRERLLAK